MAYYGRKVRVSFEQCHNIYDIIEEKHVLPDIYKYYNKICWFFDE